MRRKGPWSPEQVASFLETSRAPLRLACNGSSGHPVMASLWYAPLGGQLWCATQSSASIAKLIARDPHCAFEVAQEAAPYCGVRGRALAKLHEAEGERVLRELIARYLGSDSSRFARWLLSRADQEIAISLEPLTLLSWDFAERMGDAAA